MVLAVVHASVLLGRNLGIFLVRTGRMGGHEITVSCTRIRGLGTTASYVDVFGRSWSAFFAS